MRLTRLLPLVLSAMLAQPLYAVDGNANPGALAQRLERELTQAMTRAQQGAEAVDTGTLDRIEGEIRSGTAQWSGRQDALPADTAKLDQLRGLLHNARLYNEHLALGEAWSLPYSTLAAAQRVMARSLGSLGSSCELAGPLELGKPLSTDLAPAERAGDQFWLRIQPSDQSITVSTLGSAGDVDLAVYAHCGDDQAVLANDDHYGLQALAQLPASVAGELFVRVRNLDAQAPVEARIEAVLAGGFSGTVSVTPAGATPLAGFFVSYFSSPSTYYLGRTQTAADGSYALSALTAGSYYARTANSASQTSVVHEAYDGIPCINSDHYYIYDCNAGALTAIVVSDGQTTSDIDFDLELARSLQVIVRDATDARPLAATVFLYRNGSTVTNTYSDAAGRARFTNLLADVDYRVVIAADGYQSEVYDNIACPGNCDPSLGTPIIFAASAPYFRELIADLTPARRLLIHVPVLDLSSASAEARLLYPSSQIAASGYTYYQGSVPGYRTVVLTDPPIGSFYLQAGYNGASFWRIYPNIDCLDDCASLLAQGQTITTTAAPGTQEIYVDVRPFPSVIGTVTDAVSGEPVDRATASLLTLGSGYGGSDATDINGEYVVQYVRPGTFLVIASSPNHVDVAFPNAPCSVINGANVCPMATPVTVGTTQATYRFDFALTPSGIVRGDITIEGRSPPTYYYPQLNLRRSDGTSVSGVVERVGTSYSMTDVEPGTYRASMPWQIAHYGQIYPGIDCADTACNSVTQGQAVVVGPSPLSGINFDFRLRRGAKGRVIDASTGLPISGAVLDLWLNGASYPSNTMVSGPDGRFALAFNESYIQSFKIATSTGGGYVNEIYRNIRCPLGPAIFNLCDIELGESVSTPHAIDSSGITIRLMPESAGALFDDSFDD
jgi:hypothetical protein